MIDVEPVVVLQLTREEAEGLADILSYVEAADELREHELSVQRKLDTLLNDLETE